MSSAARTRRKPRSTMRRTSALQALLSSGLVAMFAGAADLASNRKRVLRKKLRRRIGATR
jgi:hypothetical protein